LLKELNNTEVQAANPIRVLVVDDSAIMRGALSRKIEADPRFKVVDTAANGRDGVAKALRYKPDVVTLDVDMPIMNGLDALKAIIREGHSQVIMVSAQTEAGAAITLEALDIGAIDFIPKSRGTEHIHEKLLAAASARSPRRKSSASKPSLVRPAAIARSATGPRVNAKIVIIGSSTGGPQALQAVLGQLPDNLPVPVVVAQHMPPHFTKALAQRLSEICKLKVVEAQDGDVLTRGTIYIAPGGMQLRVTANDIKIAPDQGESLYKPSVDVLAESAHAAFGKNVLGVMLTGMGGDGAVEFTKLKKAGGYNIAQDQTSCVVYGMPRSLAEAGGADEILPLDSIGGRIRSALGF
jgi:two-component system chemotaxis response regulator CheB